MQARTIIATCAFRCYITGLARVSRGWRQAVRADYNVLAMCPLAVEVSYTASSLMSIR